MVIISPHYRCICTVCHLKYFDFTAILSQYKGLHLNRQIVVETEPSWKGELESARSLQHAARTIRKFPFRSNMNLSDARDTC